MQHRRRSFRSIAALLAPLAICACAEGEYRIPYVDGTRVAVVTDHFTHDTPDAAMYDLVAVDGPGIVAAAAPGWVRYIEDGHSANSTERSIPNNYVWIEHPGDWCQPRGDEVLAPGLPRPPRDCVPCDREYCNEWTIYAHMVEGSVTGAAPLGAGLKEGDWVEAGQPLGIEGDVGFASGRHLHFFVARIDPNVAPDEFGYYLDWIASMGADPLAPELIPRVCAGGSEPELLHAGSTYTAAPCP